MKLVFHLVICTLFLACNSDDPDPIEQDVLIFGSFFGECLGESCIEIYKLEGGKLYEDTKDEYPSVIANEYAWIERSTEDYQLVSDLLNDFPTELYAEEEIVIGMPDAGDWGGVFLSSINNGEESFWLIDYIEDSIPEYLHNYTRKIKTAIDSLK